MKTPTKGSINRKQNKNGLSFVKDLKDLKSLIAEGYHEFRIALGGSAGAVFSRKDIIYNSRSKKYHIINWIDDSEQKLTEKELFKKGFTNIGEALKKNCLIVDLTERII